MYSLVVIFALVCTAAGRPIDDEVILTQDSYGNYNLFYSTKNFTRVEKADNGNVIGGYSYLDKEGMQHTIKYIASNKGFVAEGDIPRVVTETPEVSAARASHLAFVEQTRALLPQLSEKDEEKEEVIEEIVVVSPSRFAQGQFPTGRGFSAQRPNLQVQVKEQIPVQPVERFVPVESDKPQFVPQFKRKEQFSFQPVTRFVASNEPTLGISEQPTGRFAATQDLKEQVMAVIMRKKEVDNRAEIKQATEDHFAAHKKALEALALEYRKLAQTKTQTIQ